MTGAAHPPVPSAARQLLRTARIAWQRFLNPRGRSVLLNGEYELCLDPAAYLSHPTRPVYEPETVAEFAALLRPGMRVFDIGANQGLFSLIAAKKVEAPGAVIAVEAAPAALELLSRHVQLNSAGEIVTIVAAVAGGTEGELVEFPVHFFAHGWAAVGQQSAVGTSMMAVTVTIDALSRRFAPPDVVKIDVEGYEHRVLSGAVDTLRGHRPVVLCALHPEELEQQGSSFASVMELMTVQGYDAARIGGGAVEGPVRDEVIFKPRP